MKVTRRRILAFCGVIAGSLAAVARNYSPIPTDDSVGDASGDANPPETVVPPADVEVAEGVEMVTDLYVDFLDWEWMGQFTERDPIGNVDLIRDEAYYERSLSVEIPEGAHYGTSLHYRFSNELSWEPEELWASYYVYFPESFDPEGQVGKLPGPAGTYENAGWGGRRSNGTNGWSARMGFRNGESDTIGLDYYVYHADMDDYFGDLFNWDRSLSKGQWHRIDQYIRLNAPGEDDGILAGWVDGDKAYDRRDVRFRETAELKIEDYWFTVYWGGTNSSPADNRILFDNLTLRTRA